MVVALAPNIAVVLLGWCICQVFFNATLAAQAAVLPDQVPTQQRGAVSGLLGLAVPAASVAGTYLVQAFDNTDRAMFAGTVRRRGPLRAAVRLAAHRPAARPGRQAAMVAARAGRHLLREPAHATRTSRGRSRPASCSSWPTRSSSPSRPTTCSSSSAAARTRCRGRSTSAPSPNRSPSSPSRRSPEAVRPAGRRKVFVIVAAVIYASALFVIASADAVDGYLVGMAIGGLGFGMYMAVDLALVADVLPDPGSPAKDLGVLNIAGALPFALAPAVAPGLLAPGTVATPSCTPLPEPAPAGAAAIVPVRGVR